MRRLLRSERKALALKHPPDIAPGRHCSEPVPCEFYGCCNSPIVGEAWVPKAGLAREDFLLYVRRVAAECDLFEYQLTGKDRE